jgi:hypothetical protein
MAYIAPFRAFRYDPAKVDPARVVTQPYDKITPQMQNRYYDAEPHNLVRIILGKTQPNMFTLVPPRPFRIGGAKASSCRIRSNRYTNTFSAFSLPAAGPN